MKNFKFLTFLIGSGLFFSCEQNDIDSTWNYLPLEVGNYWTFSNSFKREVTGVQKEGKKEYFILVTPYDTTYIRVAKNKVLALKPGEQEAVMFDTKARVKDKWKFNQWEVTLQNDTSNVAIGGQVISGCKQYYFDIPGMADEEYNLWLAPGIGFIQSRCLGECIGGYVKITDARIGGVVPGFLVGI